MHPFRAAIETGDLDALPDVFGVSATAIDGSA